MSDYHIIEETPEETAYEILLGIKRVAQPEGDAQFNPRKTGDCFLCSSYAIISYFAEHLGKTPPTMEDLYKVWSDKDIGAASGSTYWSLDKFWHRWQYMLEYWDLDLAMETDPPVEVNNYMSINNYGPQFYTGQALIKRVRTYLEAGYAIHTEMSHKKSSDYIKEGYRPSGSDHVVVIDGYKSSYKRTLSCSGEGYGASWSGSTNHYIHVVDSSRKKPETYWVEVDEWVREYGGFCMWFIRPRKEKRFTFPESKLCPDGHVRKLE